MSTIAEPGATTTSTINPHVLEVIRIAEQELTGLLQRRAEITRRISALKQMLSGRDELFGRSILDDELCATADRGVASRRRGLTQGCRLVLMEACTPLRARQGCEELQRRFPELAKRHKHLRASVTTVFRRLAGYSEARSFLDDEVCGSGNGRQSAPRARRRINLPKGPQRRRHSFARGSDPLLPPRAQRIGNVVGEVELGCDHCDLHDRLVVKSCNGVERRAASTGRESPSTLRSDGHLCNSQPSDGRF